MVLEDIFLGKLIYLWDSGEWEGERQAEKRDERRRSEMARGCRKKNGN